MRKPVLVIAFTVVVVAGAVGFVFVKIPGEPQAKAGECVTLTNHNDNRADVMSTGCATGDARFKVGKALADAGAQCPIGDEEYLQVVPSSGGGKLCLLPNLVEGTCYRPDDKDVSWDRSACTGEDTIKVTKVIPAVGDQAGCPDSGDDSASLVYPEPPITYCIVWVQPLSA